MAEITAKDAKVLCLIARLKGISEGAKIGMKYWNDTTEIGFIKKVTTEGRDEIIKIAEELQQLLYPDFRELLQYEIAQS